MAMAMAMVEATNTQKHADYRESSLRLAMAKRSTNLCSSSVHGTPFFRSCSAEAEMAEMAEMEEMEMEQEEEEEEEEEALQAAAMAVRRAGSAER
jgi:hypothetical protein